MDASEITTTIRSFIEERFLIEQDALKNEADLFEGGIVDSFGLIEMVAFLEQSFSIKLVKEEFMSPRMATVSGIVELIQDKLGSS